MNEELKEQPIETSEDAHASVENEIGETWENHENETREETENNDLSSEESKQDEWFTKDALEFQKAFPDIDTDELFSDKAFLKFSEGKVGSVGLADIYRDYTELVESVKKDTLAKAEAEFAKRRANAKATPGSLTEISGETDSLYSLEDMKNMSQKAIIANWDKVQKSLKNLKK